MREGRLFVVGRPGFGWPGLKGLMAELGLTPCGSARNLLQAALQVNRLKPDLILLSLGRPSSGWLERALAFWWQLPGYQLYLLAACGRPRRVESLGFAGQAHGLPAEAEAFLLLTSPAVPQRQGAALAGLLLRGLLGIPRPALRSGHGLTARELEVIRLVGEGHSSKAIANQLGISLKTVETHRANLMRKLRLHSVGELVRYAIRHHLVCP